MLPFRILLLVVLLLSGRGANARPSPASPADTTRWIDADDTPWLREIRYWPAAQVHPAAWWLALVQAHPQPSLTRVTLLDRLSEALEITDLAASYPVHLAARRLAFQLPYPQVRAEMLLNLADYHTELAHYDSAAHYLPLAEHQFRLDHNLGGAVRCLIRLARTAEQQGRYAASLAYSQHVLELASTGNTRRFHTDAQIQLGTLYAHVGDYPTARRYLLAALAAATHYNYPDRSNLALGELGEVCRQQHQWPQARAYFERSIAISRQIKEEPYALARQLSLASLLEDEGQYPTAAALGRQVLARLQAAQRPLLVPLAQALLARLALRRGEVAAAVAYGRQSLAGSEHARLLAGVLAASAVLTEAYTRQHAYAPALAALRQYTAAHDSLTGEAVRRRAALLQFSQQQRAQQAQITELRHQNQVQAQQAEITHLRAQCERLGLGALAALGLALAAGTLRQYRRRQARRDQALRQRLAADLHDEVGSLLTHISLQSDLLREAPAAPDQTLARLDRLSDTSRRAARQMADVVWGLHAGSATLPEVLVYMRDHAHEVLPLAGLTVHFAVTDEAATARPSAVVCQTLYLIYKEALHNVVKHAHGATQVAVQLSYAAGQLCLHLRDNAPAPAAPPRPGGHGLASMRRRAEAVGGTLQLLPVPTGFALKACLPA